MKKGRQIDKLANFIMAEIDGEPSRDEGAADCAIRIMRKMQAQKQVAPEKIAGRLWIDHAKRTESDCSPKIVFNDLGLFVGAVCEAVNQVTTIAAEVDGKGE